MRRPVAAWLTGLAVALTGACGASAEDPAPGPRSAGEMPSGRDAPEPLVASTPAVVAASSPVIVGEPSASMPTADVSGRVAAPDATGPSPPRGANESPGGITRPPRVTVASSTTTLELDAWTFCFARACADGFAPDPLPSVGADDAVEVRFPRDGWSFQADFRRAADPCARHQHVDLEPTGPTSFVLRPAGAAGTYAVTLFGRGDGDLVVSFAWTTTGDGPLPEPAARLAVLADHDGRTDSYGVELDITNLARSPARASATVTVTAANGNALSFDAVPRPAGPACPAIEGSLSWDGPDDQGLAAAALGPAPFTYDVVVTLDGIDHAATAQWPSDEVPGDEPSVALDFTPPLPALDD